MTCGVIEILADAEINGKVMNHDFHFRFTMVTIKIIGFILVPAVVLIYTNFKIYKNLKIISENLGKILDNQRLQGSVLKAKFSLYVTIMFVFCNMFKIVGTEGLYGLYVLATSENINDTYFVSSPKWVKLWDAFTFGTLTVLNSSTTYYVYKWLQSSNQRKAKKDEEMANPGIPGFPGNEVEN